MKELAKVIDGSCDRSDVIKARREWQNTVGGNNTAGRLHPRDTPQNEAGRVIEPPVWLPIAPRHIPQATAAADPLDEPPGVRSRFHGFRVIGRIDPGVRRGDRLAQ